MEEGDKNIKFFYIFINNREMKNFIYCIKVGDIMEFDYNKIRGEVMYYFKNIFNEEYMSWLIFEKIGV